MEQLVHDTVNDLHELDAQAQAAQACSGLVIGSGGCFPAEAFLKKAQDLQM